MLHTVVAYVLTLFVVVFAAMGLPASLFGALGGRRMGLLWSSMIGFTAAWALVEALWVWLEGGHLPMALVAIAFCALFVNIALRKGRSTRVSRSMLAGEAWALLLLAACLLLFTDPVRWV